MRFVPGFLSLEKRATPGGTSNQAIIDLGPGTVGLPPTLIDPSPTPPPDSTDLPPSYTAPTVDHWPLPPVRQGPASPYRSEDDFPPLGPPIYIQ